MPVAGELHVYQFQNHPLIQITDGRPAVNAMYPDGWNLRGTIASDAITEVVTVAPSRVLADVAEKGWSQLDRFEIQESWRKKWVTH